MSAQITRVTIRRAEIRKLLRGPEVQRDLRRRADKIVEKAGPGFGVDPYVGKNRARVGVKTISATGRFREASERALSRSLDAGRD